MADDGTLWSNQVEVLKTHFRCICVTLPNFGPEPDRAGGYSFAEQVQLLKATITPTTFGRAHLPGDHDWGACIGYLRRCISADDPSNGFKDGREH